jgi:uncharacterized protein involved in outer membrane biogenesis
MPTTVCKPDPIREPVAPRDVVSGARYRQVRRVAILLALVIAIPSLLLVAVLIGLNPAIRASVEKMATAATGVPVSLDSARVNIIGGIHLSRLAIANPKEFREVRAFRFGRLDVEVSLASLASKTIEIQDVLLVNPEITIEFDHGKTNWGVLSKQLTAKSQRPVESEEKKFIIHRLRITKALVVVRAPSLPKGVAVRLRDIELEGIGSGEAAPFSLVLSTVVQALITGAIEEWTGIPGELSGILGRETSQTSDAMGKRMPKATKEKE